jgi:hypothetical protein
MNNEYTTHTTYFEKGLGTRSIVEKRTPVIENCFDLIKFVSKFFS